MSAGAYETGDASLRALRADPRFSCACRVPKGTPPPGGWPLLVAVHGSRRRSEETGAWFRDLSDRRGLVVLAPLFPEGVPEGEEGAYKRLAADGLRFDLLLLAMVEEAAARWPLDAERFFLFGFSGGAHLAHRFLLVHPERLSGVSVAAPGVVTLPGAPHPWWVGTADMARVLGRPLDPGAVARVPVHAVVGEADTETWEIAPRPGGPWDRPGADLAGPDRPARLAALVAGLRGLGAAVEHETVPGVGHEGAPLAARAALFFERLSERQGESP